MMQLARNDVSEISISGQIRETSDKPLRSVLESLGGWPVLDPNWTEGKAARLDSVESLLGRLRGELNQGVLVEQWVGPDDKNSSVNIIQVSADSLSTLSAYDT